MLLVWFTWRVLKIDLQPFRPTDGVDQQTHQLVVVKQSDLAPLVMHEISQQEQNLFCMLLPSSADGMQRLHELAGMLAEELQPEAGA